MELNANSIIWRNDLLVFFLDKTKQIWWKKLFQHEAEIDTTKLDCSRPIDELPEDTQAQINQIQFDEQQKLKGTPGFLRFY